VGLFEISLPHLGSGPNNLDDYPRLQILSLLQLSFRYVSNLGLGSFKVTDFIQNMYLLGLEQQVLGFSHIDQSFLVIPALEDCVYDVVSLNVVDWCLDDILGVFVSSFDQVL